MAVYRVTVLKWCEHNPKHKKGFKSFMFNNGFFSDHKVAQLKPIECVLFIYMLCVASETSSNQCQISVKSLPKHIRIGSKLMRDCLRHFESLQLVTFEELPSLRIELKEEKRIKEKLNSDGVQAPPPAPPVVSQKISSTKDKNRAVRHAYLDSYVEKYGADCRPAESARLNSAIADIVRRVGADDAERVVRYYLTHEDGLYLKASHTIGLCQRDCEALRTQMITGVAITGAKIRNLERSKSTYHHDQLARVNRGEL